MKSHSRPPKRSTETPKPATRKRTRGSPRAGTVVIWAKGVEQRYDISPPTRWRWERDGLLPPRNVHIGGRSGWRPETLAASEDGMAPRRQ
jgi:predicted DNA-binding transcriptional regulator AlpA